MGRLPARLSPRGAPRSAGAVLFLLLLIVLRATDKSWPDAGAVAARRQLISSSRSGCDAEISRDEGYSASSTFGRSSITLPAAISRSDVTTSLLLESTSGRAPLSNCLARLAAPSTSSKRLETLSRQSSTVILAIIRQFSGLAAPVSTRIAGA